MFWVTHARQIFLHNLAVHDSVCILTKKVVAVKGDQEYGAHTKIDSLLARELIFCGQRSDLFGKRSEHHVQEF